MEYSLLPLKFKCILLLKKIILKHISVFPGYEESCSWTVEGISKILLGKALGIFGFKGAMGRAFRENEMLEALKGFTDVGILSFGCIF